MSLDNVFLIIIASLYFIALLISGMLAFFYNLKHKPFLIVNKVFQKQVYDAWSDYNLEILPTPLKNTFETKNGEDIYLVQKLLIDISSKSKKQIKNSSRDLNNNIYGVFKNNYKLISRSEKEFFEKQTVYLSNKRIIIENNEKFIKIKLHEIQICQFAVLNYAQAYEKILLIETAKQRFKFIIKDLQLGFFVTQFIKKGL